MHRRLCIISVDVLQSIDILEVVIKGVAIVPGRLTTHVDCVIFLHVLEVLVMVVFAYFVVGRGATIECGQLIFLDFLN